MFPRYITLLLIVACLPLVGCGTTSAFIPTENNLTSLKGSNYSDIVVYDFIDKTHIGQEKAQSKRRKKIMDFASQRFADLVALKIKKTGVFEKTTRQSKKQANEHVSLDGNYLVLRGEITRYYRGNTFFRVLIGYGIGTAFLDADIGLYDAKTNALMGTFEVDKNSWFLGGVLAITHSIEHFMKGSANKIAEEIAAINHNTVEPVHENASMQTLATLKSNQNDIVLTDTHQLVQ